jgi:Cof subfamily protein (haloacid dehalogenase superfamily)
VKTLRKDRRYDADQPIPLPHRDARRYRMVVSDIDGTLLTSDSILPEEVRVAVAQARKAGIIFTVATGRRFTTTEKILRDLSLFGSITPSGAQSASQHELALQSPPVILQTGAIVVGADGADVLFRDPLSAASARRALRILVDAGLQPIAYEDRIFEQRLMTGPSEFDSRAASEYLSSNPHLVIRMSYDQLINNTSPIQIAVIDQRERLNLILPFLNLVDCRSLLSYSGNLDSCFMEVFHKGCSKGRAVEKVANHFGFTLDETVCIGDNWNDLEMLKMAGCGIVVANAEEGVAPFARRLTVSNDEHAVAVILNQIMLGGEPGFDNPAYVPGDLDHLALAD